ncbi:MAG TPA: hypothetical protein PKE63_07550 [Lacibacter sp.]|nr:hypothetical protein [Lacibacter sp.]HMO89035.1 hypothetical protein [Lacibacter sp.]HMP87118.1 hypothetical protein [Lacibacter sp.]
MQKWIICLLLASPLYSFSQELYVFSNPASNIPSHSLVAKTGIKTMRSVHSGNREYRLMPELQAGLTKNLMLAGSLNFSDMFFRNGLQWEGARLYTKYRFFSSDAVHRHFRLAAYAQGAWSRNPLVYQEFNLEGDNSGIQTGLIATQLVKKLAVSGGLSYVRQLEQKDKVSYGRPFSNEALQYNLSMGYLLFPRSYTSYQQTNLNLYCELLGQRNTDLGAGFTDLAPALQLIFNSRTRFNLGGRFQVAGNAHRMARESVFLSVEHYFLNAF